MLYDKLTHRKMCMKRVINIEKRKNYKIVNKIKQLSILILTLLVFGCSKNDSNDVPPVGSLTNLNYTETNGTVLLQWDAYEGASRYQVFVDGVSVSDIPDIGTSTMSAMLTNVPDQSKIEVKAYSDADATALIAKGETTYTVTETPLEAPNAPSNVSVTKADKTSATLTFSYSGTCSGIKIYSEAKTESSTPLLSIDSVSEGENSVTVKNLTSGTDYTLYLYAYNTNGDKTVFSSQEVSVTFSTAKETAAISIDHYGYNEQYGGGLTMSVVIAASDLFSDKSQWTESGELVLELYCSDTADGDPKLATSDNSTYPNWQNNQIVDLTAWSSNMDFQEGQTYYLQVIAKNKAGDVLGKTIVQEVKFETPASNDIIPGKPGNISVTLNGSTPTISWDKAKDADSYIVYVSTSQDMSYKTKVGETSSTSMDDPDRGQNVRVYYQVAAVSSTGNKTFSDVVDIWL